MCITCIYIYTHLVQLYDVIINDNNLTNAWYLHNPSRCSIFNMCCSWEFLLLSTFVASFSGWLASQFNSPTYHKEILLTTEAMNSCKMLQIYIPKSILFKGLTGSHQQKIAEKKCSLLPPGLTAFDPCSSSLGHQLCQATQAADGLGDGTSIKGWL